MELKQTMISNNSELCCEENLQEVWERIKKFPIKDWKIHISHNDADGLACFVIYYFEKVKIYNEYFTCDAGTLLVSLFRSILNKGEIPSDIFITDLSFNERDLPILNEFKDLFLESGKVKLTLIDHHVTALWCNDWYSGCSVKNEKGVSAAKLYFNKIKDSISDERIQKRLEEYVDIISMYDTWEWKKVQKEVGVYESEMILCTRYQPSFYISHTIDKIISGNTEGYFYTDEDLALILKYREDRDNKIKTAIDNIRPVTINNLLIYITISNVNASTFGEQCSKLFPNSVFGVLYIDTKTLSLRTQSMIDLSEFAKSFGGGGHPQAAGCVLSNEVLLDVLHQYFAE